jgi:HAD superfamily hydrolase (TIGR01509 family)
MNTGYIFDFDGVLVDTMPLHYASYSQALYEAGVALDKKQFYYQAGMTGREQIRYFCEKAGVEADIEEIYRRKSELAQSNIHLATPILSNINLLKILKAAGHPVAIASGSSKPSIIPISEKFGIEVDTIVSSEDVSHGKPHPELFLTAAKRLGVPPGDCVVFEDSEVGIEAAKAGGMKAMRFYKTDLS